ncbi:MAG: dTMP kinase [Candidatus Paceibacterota bacterium]
MISNTFGGKFIVFEGLDGSGQTTQARLLGQYFASQGREVLLTKEPTQLDGQFPSSVAQSLRDVLDKKVKMEAKPLQELFAQDRREHLEREIIPALKSGKLVICDRYCFSSFAFGAAHGNSMDYLISLNKDFLMPDFTFLLMVSPKICMQRVVKRNEGVKFFEVEEKLAKTWQQYEEVVRRFPQLQVIDGERSIEEIHEEIRFIINK